MKIHELFHDDPTRWTQRVYARDVTDSGCLPENPDAVCWCLAGAALLCYASYGPDGPVSLGEYDRIMARLRGRVGDVTAWNDAPRRTFAEINALVKDLDV